MKKIYMILPLALTLCFMVGCQDKAAMAELEEFKAQAAVEQKNIEIIERYFEEVDKYYLLAKENKQNLSFVDELFSSDYALHSALSEIHGLDGLREYIASGPNIWLDMEHVLDENIARGNIVVSRGHFEAIQKGELLGVPATGKHISSPVIYIHRIEDGKIREAWVDWDSLFNMMTTQLGMELKPKEAEK